METFLFLTFLVIAFVGHVVFLHTSKRWKQLSADGVYFVYKNKGSYLYKIALPHASSFSAYDPPIMEVKGPFLRPAYVAQHVQQMQRWWQPLAKTHAIGSRSLATAIKNVSFSPNFGWHVTVKKMGELTQGQLQDLLALVVDMNNSWRPLRIEQDSSYGLRAFIAKYAPLIAFLAATVLFTLIEHLTARVYFGDSFYWLVSLAVSGAIAALTWVVLNSFISTSVYAASACKKACSLAFAVSAVIVAYTTVHVNEFSPTTICRVQAPVSQWYERRGKSTSYYATLDLNSCPGAPRKEADMRVSYLVYQSASSLSVGVYRGVLGRYYATLE